MNCGIYSSWLQDFVIFKIFTYFGRFVKCFNSTALGHILVSPEMAEVLAASFGCR